MIKNNLGVHFLGHKCALIRSNRVGTRRSQIQRHENSTVLQHPSERETDRDRETYRQTDRDRQRDRRQTDGEKMY